MDHSGQTFGSPVEPGDDLSNAAEPIRHGSELMLHSRKALGVSQPSEPAVDRTADELRVRDPQGFGLTDDVIPGLGVEPDGGGLHGASGGAGVSGAGRRAAPRRGRRSPWVTSYRDELIASERILIAVDATAREGAALRTPAVEAAVIALARASAEELGLPESAEELGARLINTGALGALAAPRARRDPVGSQAETDV